MRSVTVHCLHQFSAALLVSHRLFECGTGSMLQLSIMSPRETTLKTLTFSVVLMLVLNQFLPLALNRSTIGHLLKKIKTAINPSAKENRRL